MQFCLSNLLVLVCIWALVWLGSRYLSSHMVRALITVDFPFLQPPASVVTPTHHFLCIYYQHLREN